MPVFAFVVQRAAGCHAAAAAKTGDRQSLLINTDRQAAMRSLTLTAVMNSLASRIRVSVGAMSDTSRTCDGRRLLYRNMMSFASVVHRRSNLAAVHAVLGQPVADRTVILVVLDAACNLCDSCRAA